MPFTRMLWRAHSTASVRVSASMPAFAAHAGSMPVQPVLCSVMLMLRMLPPFFFMYGYASREQWNVPYKSISSTAFHWFSLSMCEG